MITTDKSKYDVAVAGAGIGGLCTAALLAKRGHRVLLAEGLERLGGRFSTIVQEGFKTPTGGLAIQTRGVIESIFKEVGAAYDVIEIGNTSVWMYGEWHELPPRGQISALLSLLDKIGAKKSKLLVHLAKGVAKEKIMGTLKKMTPTTLDPEDKLSFRDWLTQYTDDERVIKLFHALTSAISTVNDYEYPASHWFTYVSSVGQGGLPHHGIARQGNIAPAEELAKAIRAHGGDVWVNAPITRIIVKNAQVEGLVIRKDGQDVEVKTGVLASDLGPAKTIALAGRSSFDDEYLSRADALRPSPIVANIIASDRPLVKSEGGLLFVGTQRIVAGMPLTNFSPELAPPGQHLTVIWGTPASCLEHMNPEEEARLNLEDLRQVFPDFDRHGRILRVDFRDINDEFPALRSWMGYDMSQETPLANLFHVGDAVKPFGWEGLAACAQGATLAADLIDNGFKKSRFGLA